MERARKEQEISAISERFSRAKASFLVDFKGMDVEQVTTLRKGLRKLNSEMKVVRNTLARRALKEHPASDAAIGTQFVGTNAVVFAFEDPSASAKFLADFGKDVPHLQLKVGVMDGQALDENRIKYLATLPGKDELRAKLLSVFQAPATQFVRQLAAPSTSFVRLLAAFRDSK
ncbi:MAG: 50S ribosomal protein L10 [Bdellovibrionales bacterium]|nr:50S ribosomal protein L10 [Bdellovibrionales bacterium]